ncbi:MAG: hypothetical protein ACLUKO_04050 [Enterocloster bolteae]
MALVLYHAFVMGADERMHQLGTADSGATPGQIRACCCRRPLLKVPVLAGIAAGGAAPCFCIWLTISRALGMKAAYLTYHPLVPSVSGHMCSDSGAAAAAQPCMSRVNPLMQSWEEGKSLSAR